MNPVALDLLDFPEALKALADRAHSEPGAALALALKPDLTPAAIQASWALIEEARALLAVSESPDFHDLTDLSALLKTLGPEGSLLEPLELLVISRVARTAREAKAYFAEKLELSPKLSLIANDLDDFKPLVEDLEKSVGPEGEILDTASPLLARLRRDLASAKAALTSRLTELMRDPEFKPLLRDEIITTRGDRFVVPVRAGAAGRSRGLVHDWSKSGATAYLEPLETVEDNNRLTFLKSREKEEIYRIILSLSSQCRALAPVLATSQAALTKLDLILAEARLAHYWKAVTPDYQPGQGLDLRELRHPLLEKRLAAEGRELIPLDLVVLPDSPLLVISGLNAGGKTVALKTLGLVLALAKTGLPIPAAEGSKVDFPEDIIAIMGDNQDLAADLSTFSGHIKAIGEALNEAREGVVILLDEIGGGTDPAEGAALGLAVLEKLRAKGALCLAATHYHLIKSWAALTPGVVSVAVRASKDGRPIYGLTYGAPGFSGGLAMARRLGLPEDLVQRAESYLDEGHKEAMNLLKRLDEEREALFLEKTALAEERRDLAQVTTAAQKALAKQTEDLKRQSTRLDQEIRSALVRQRRELAELKKEIRESLAKNQTPDPVALSLKAAALAKALTAVRPEATPTLDSEPLTSVAPGERVLVAKLKRPGVVKSVNLEKSEALIDCGAFSIKSPLSDLFKAPKTEGSPQTRVTFAVTQETDLGLSLNLLGQTVEEAIEVIDREIDQAALSGRKRLIIIHGLGTGRLRKGLTAHLKTHPKVQELIWPTPGPGGLGVTTVELAP